jgi:glycine oxidase
LAEARILEFNTQVRPCLPDNLPSLHFDRERNVLSINGLYRHGFLLAPAIVEEVLSLLLLKRSSASGEWPCLHDTGFASMDTQVQREVQSC